MANCVSDVRVSGDFRVVRLPEGTSARAIAEVSREAVVAFTRGAGKAWAKRDLGGWLAGPYRSLTAFAAGDEAPPSRPPSSGKLRAAPRITAAEKIDSLLSGANEEVLATLMMAAPPTLDLGFIERAIRAGHVTRSRDAAGRIGWVPIDMRGMSLADRILSLVTVDYLMRPGDYVALLSVCGVCQVVSFDAQTRMRGRCGAHRVAAATGLAR
jgi:hypothetical protein